MKKVFNLFVLLAMSASILAQQEPLSALFWNSYSYYNPANSGFIEDVFINLQGRNQWIDIDGNPKTIWVITDFNINEKNGLGANFSYDEAGTLNTQRFNLNYNRQIIFSEEHRLGIGLSFGLKKLEYRLPEMWDVVLDPAITKEEYSDQQPDVRMGVQYYFKGFQFGASAMNLDQSIYKDDFFEYRTVVHLYFLASYEFEVNENLDLVPRVLLGMYEPFGGIDQYQLNFSAVYKDMFMLGATIRNEDWFSFNTGVKIKGKWSIHYAFDPKHTDDELYGFGTSHELSLNYLLNKKDKS